MSDARERRIQSGLESLVRQGVSLDTATAEELDRASATDPAAALAVAERLGAIPSAASAAALARLEAGAAEDKLLRREVRRSLYRLKQKGVVPMPRPRATDDTSRPPSPLAGPAAEGYLSFSDPSGDRLLWLVKPRRAGGLYHLSTIVNEPGGLRNAALAELGRKNLRALREELRTRHGLRLVEVDWRYCDWIAYEGYERARARGEVPEPATHYPQLRTQLFATPAQPAELSMPGGGDPAAALADSASLFQEEELEPWFLPPEAVEKHLARYREIRDSPIVLDRTAQVARIEEIVLRAVEEVFSEERSASWQRRLREMCTFFARTDRPEAAARTGAVAGALANHPGGRGIPFCEELVRRTFGLFFAREAEREREEKESSVLVTPDDLRAAQARARSAQRFKP